MSSHNFKPEKYKRESQNDRPTPKMSYKEEKRKLIKQSRTPEENKRSEESIRYYKNRNDEYKTYYERIHGKQKGSKTSALNNAKK